MDIYLENLDYSLSLKNRRVLNPFIVNSWATELFNERAFFEGDGDTG